LECLEFLLKMFVHSWAQASIGIVFRCASEKRFAFPCAANVRGSLDLLLSKHHRKTGNYQWRNAPKVSAARDAHPLRNFKPISNIGDSESSGVTAASASAEAVVTVPIVEIENINNNNENK
jgi:hypothetical protein